MGLRVFKKAASGGAASLHQDADTRPGQPVMAAPVNQWRF
jgi:hypothetical protein